jgi:hypothetical protein
MFGNLWSLFCFDIPALASVAIVGVLTLGGWVSAFDKRPFRVSGSLIALAASILFDGASVLNDFLGERLFPMTAYGGDLMPFFCRWQILSAAILLMAGVLLMAERSKLNRWALWGTIVQSLIHCGEFGLFILIHRP